jgi:hypothetical protein
LVLGHPGDHQRDWHVDQSGPPHYPGQETFRGLQLHTHDYVSADRLAGRRVAAVDAIVWATGFRAALAHLEPLALRTATGGIRMTGTQVAADPRVHLVGFGPSQSTVGANRAGREAAGALVRYLAHPALTG